MSYVALEASAQDGAPVLLFQFAQGSLTWRYASIAQSVTALGYTWDPSSISIGEVNQSNDMAKDTLNVKLPRNHPLAVAFMDFVPDNMTSVTVFRGHLGDTEFITYWKGRVSGINPTTDGWLTLACEPVFTSLRRPGLRARYTKACRHSLYQPACGVNKALFAETTYPTALAGAVLTAPTTQPDGWYTGGMVEAPDGAVHFIMKHAGSTFTLLRPFDTLAKVMLEAGYGVSYGAYYGAPAIKLYPGCDRTIETCDSKFNNKLNWGGFKWIPIKNPMGGSSIV